MVLTFSIFIQSFTMLIFVIINLMIGLKIASRYFDTGLWEMLVIGIAWIGLAFLWIADAYKFIYDIFYNQPTPLIVTINLILVIGILPIPALLWLFGFSQLLNVKKRNQYILSFISFIGLFIIDILLFFTFFTQPDYSSYHYSSIYNSLLFIGALSLVLITGLIFAFQALKSNEKRIKLKGKLLLIAFIFFTLGALLDTIFTYDDFLFNLISRTILLGSSILFYMGFILPDWVSNFLKKSP